MLPDINLLPKYEKERSLTYVLFMIVLMSLILLFGLMIFQYFHVKGNLETAHAANEQLSAEKELLEQKIASIDSNGAGSLEEAVSYAEKSTVPTSKLIDQLMKDLPQTGYLSTYNYNKDGAVEIETQFETMTDASAYVAKLVASDYMDDVKVDRVETFELEAPQAKTEEQMTETDEKDEANKKMFNTIPRYKVNYSFQVDRSNLKKEADDLE